MTASTTLYNPTFYQNYQDGSSRSARQVAPLVMNLVAPQSVIDVGCGIGTWLQAFSEAGATRIRGLDGDYVERSLLRIPQQDFLAHDLNTELPKQDAEFDLVVSLEVAEHIAGNRAADFVGDLCRLGPAVLFSGAIPHQGGAGHINEQWPEYWAKLFAQHGYVALDCVRPVVWDNEAVEYFYAQNIFLFVDSKRLANYPQLNGVQPSAGPLARVHPRKWLQAHDPRRQLLKPTLRALPFAAWNALMRRIKRLH